MAKVEVLFNSVVTRAERNAFEETVTVACRSKNILPVIIASFAEDAVQVQLQLAYASEDNKSVFDGNEIMVLAAENRRYVVSKNDNTIVCTQVAPINKEKLSIDVSEYSDEDQITLSAGAETVFKFNKNLQPAAV